MGMIDLNVDLGEGRTDDEILLGLATSVNIACGGHAGDHATMCEAVRLAMAAGVAVGAHPGFEDRENFGRRELSVTPDDVEDLAKRQLRDILTIVRRADAVLHHVKPHGALYHQADRDGRLAAAFVGVMVELCPDAILYAPPDGKLAAAAGSAGIMAWAEGFADRRYRHDGGLVPRSEPGAVITDVGDAVLQALFLMESGNYQTLCVHGDSENALGILRGIREKIFNLEHDNT
jgi:UPF0271 protein